MNCLRLAIDVTKLNHVVNIFEKIVSLFYSFLFLATIKSFNDQKVFQVKENSNLIQGLFEI